MSLFAKFVDALKNEPETTYASYAMAGETRYNVSRERAASVKKEILTHIKDTNVFILSLSSVFDMSAKPIAINKEPSSDRGAAGVLSEEERARAVEEKSGGLKNQINLDDVAAPFKTCWFQFPEGPDAEGRHALRGVIDTHDNTMTHACFLHEKSAHEYLFALVLKDERDGMLRYKFGSMTFADRDKHHSIWHTIAIFLQPFTKDYTGATVKTAERVKYKDPITGEKVLHKIKRVIMVFPKKLTKEDKELAERERADFSHRFNVRAHWRRLYYLDGRTNDAGQKLIDFNRIGKNREGEYCVAGFTYVEQGEKGPEFAPLILKTRVILGKENQDDPE